jgi:hypothetical protein
MRTFIRNTALAGAAVVAAIGAGTFATQPAQAQGIYIEGGPGWHHGWRDRDDWRWRHRRWRAEVPGCRVEVRRFWRHGHEVVERRRVCY